MFQDDYPWDVRVEKIMLSLTARGNLGHIICRNRIGGIHFEKLGSNLFVHRLRHHPNRKINEIINMPAFFSPYWLTKIWSVAKENHCKLLIVRDLPLTPTAVAVGRTLSIPIMMDMAENYPAMLRDTWRYRGPRPMDYLIRNPAVLKLVEKTILPRLDGVIVVSERSRDRVIRVGVEPARTWVVSNTPRLDSRYPGGLPAVEKGIRSLSEFIVLYVGGLEESRGLEIVVRALPRIMKRIPEVVFVVVGEGSSKAKLKTLAETLGIGKRVIFYGWLDPRSVPSAIRAADVCIIPHYVTEHTDSTVPNKIFDYMLQRKPVVCTNCSSLREIVESCGCGRIYGGSDVNDLANVVVGLNDRDSREMLGMAGYSAVVRKYNWKVDEQSLFRAVKSLGLRTGRQDT